MGKIMAIGKYDFVVVRNRTAGPVQVVFDGQLELWGPHEERTLPQGMARHCVFHSAIQWEPNSDERIARLCVVRPGEPVPEDLEVASVETSIPLDAMEPKIADDGTLLTPKVLDISNRAMRLHGRGLQTAKDGRRLTDDPVRVAAEAKFADDVIEAVADANDAASAT